MKIAVALSLSAFLIVVAQTLLGNWTLQNLNDPFVDEQQLVLAIGENAEPYSGEGPLFAVLCKDNLADIVYFNVGQSLSSGEIREFDYRVNKGEVKTVEGWMNEGFVSLRTGEDDFAQFKEDVLVDGADLAFSTVSSSGERVVTVFKLPGLDDALASVQCAK